MSEKIVHLNEEVIKGQLKELVRGSVEETLNGLLEAEAEKLTQAGRYERSEQPPVKFQSISSCVMNYAGCVGIPCAVAACNVYPIVRIPR